MNQPSEKSGHGSLESGNFTENIIYLNLTFDAKLPLPSQNFKVPRPDLTKLVSPHDWSPKHKICVTWISCIATLFASFAASCYSPGAKQMAGEWHISEVASLVGITTFCCGFAIGPMFLAPFSEITGRKPVFIGTAILLLICQICCSVTRSYSGMLVARFFAGIGGSTFSTMVGGIIADLYPPKERNGPMTLFSTAALFGTGLGPLICGFIGENTSWRWIFYLQIIIAGMICLGVMIFFRETRSHIVLSRRAKILNGWYEALEAEGCFGVRFPQEDEASEDRPRRIRWKVDEERVQSSLIQLLWTSIHRPFLLLLSEPVVFFFSLWAAFSWSILYINLSVIPLVFQATYHFSLSQANSIFAATCIGSLFAMAQSMVQDKFAIRREGWNSVPEHRLYFSCLQSILLPAGLFIFGWTSQFQVHWIVPAIGVFISTMGIFSIYLAVFNYLADSYHGYASSALAAQSFCRNMLGGIFPLVSKALFNNLGFGPAASLLGGIGAALTFVPWLLVVFGPQIRRRSKFIREGMY
ncbi:MFS transporter [Aspergillus saccharolyticus JOP 1030-1]|uniref:MFS general substrate transporter n=1 Tax=Aspergillus saccharolyticus JOP 1030-1 TaxID=1450539 RepID=A0A318ZNJ4_9EURO|nr:MFS general substrate transporter [Aspergillus saccharolyticus JOP 1030-1]PYH48547.1 MFS general substrate transporter [Aspergillus saccharolyticus JOP 1030-1]